MSQARLQSTVQTAELNKKVFLFHNRNIVYKTNKTQNCEVLDYVQVQKYKIIRTTTTT